MLQQYLEERKIKTPHTDGKDQTDRSSHGLKIIGKAEANHGLDHSHPIYSSKVQFVDD